MVPHIVNYWKIGANLGHCKASWVDNHLMELIQPVNLRAPEVIIGAKWDTSTDIWNIGCVVSSRRSSLVVCLVY